MPQIDKDTIRLRARELRETVAEVRETWLRSLIGQPLTVLAEADGTGHAANFARVALPPGTVRGSVLTINPTHLAEGLLS